MTIGSTLRWWMVCVFVMSLLVTGCSREEEATAHIKLTLQEELMPPRVGRATIRFSLTNKQTRQPVTNAEIQVEGNMTHPGMAPSRAEAIEVAPGDYEAPLDFTMPGDWYLLFDIQLPDGQTLTRQVNVDSVTE